MLCFQTKGCEITPISLDAKLSLLGVLLWLLCLAAILHNGFRLWGSEGGGGYIVSVLKYSTDVKHQCVWN